MGDLCEAEFERLAAEDPPRLIARLADPNLRPTLLTYAAEIAGRELPSAMVVAPLLALCRHAAPVVREGALLGLAYHSGAEIEAEVRRMAAEDASRGVRDVARGLLEDIAEREAEVRVG